MRRNQKLDPTATHLSKLMINASCRRSLQEDLCRYRQKKLMEAAQKRSSLKNCRRDLSNYHVPLSALMFEDGTITTSRRDMELITENYYTKLFRSSTPVADPYIPTGGIPPRILPSEVRVAIEGMKKGTAPGPDNITADFLRAGGHNLHVLLATHMTSYLHKEKIPDQWRTSRTVILFKKGDPKDLRNYRPICLLSILYKLFTKIILLRYRRSWMRHNLDSKQDSDKDSASGH